MSCLPYHCALTKCLSGQVVNNFSDDQMMKSSERSKVLLLFLVQNELPALLFSPLVILMNCLTSFHDPKPLGTRRPRNPDYSLFIKNSCKEGTFSLTFPYVHEAFAGKYARSTGNENSAEQLLEWFEVSFLTRSPARLYLSFLRSIKNSYQFQHLWTQPFSSSFRLIADGEFYLTTTES